MSRDVWNSWDKGPEGAKYYDLFNLEWKKKKKEEPSSTKVTSSGQEMMNEVL